MIIITAVFLMLMILPELRDDMNSERVQKECHAVCDDVGYDGDYAVKSGFFSYTCMCKKKQVKI